MQPSLGTANQTTTAPHDHSEDRTQVPSLRSESGGVSISSHGKAAENGTSQLPRYAVPRLDDTLHELANSVTALLLNTQILDWKLPPYSQLKRTVCEIERHAQLSSALVRRLLGQFQLTAAAKLATSQKVPSLPGPTLENVVAVRGPGTGRNGRSAGEPAGSGAVSAGPLSLYAAQIELTSSCDRCTSACFPKEE